MIIKNIFRDKVVGRLDFYCAISFLIFFFLLIFRFEDFAFNLVISSLISFLSWSVKGGLCIKKSIPSGSLICAILFLL